MVDAVLAEAIEVAKAAAVELAEDAAAVGAHLGAVEENKNSVTHNFECLLPGYRGWVWSVTLSRAPRAKDVGVDEAALLPAADALLAPPWIPWADRIQPGDLEPAMVLPLIENDPRIVPTYEVTQDEDATQIWELGLGRERVLGPEGRDDVATRWYRGSHGPTAASAIASAEPCQTCAFFVPLSGSLRLMFGACTNEWSPSDGKVVSIDHGCGAHSQTTVEQGPTQWPAPDPVFASEVVVSFDLGSLDPEPEQAPEAEPAREAQAEQASEPDAVVESAPEAAAEPVAETEPEAAPEPVAKAEPEAEVTVEEAPTEASAEPVAEAVEETVSEETAS